MKILLCCWTWQDTYQQLFELAVTGLAGAQAEVAGAQAEVASARASVDFAEKHWRNATEKEDSVVASTWEQKVKEAKQEVKEAEHKVEKAKQEVVEAEQKVEKAKQEVVEAKQEVVKAKQVQEAVEKVQDLSQADWGSEAPRTLEGLGSCLFSPTPQFCPPYLLDQLIPRRSLPKTST